MNIEALDLYGVQNQFPGCFKPGRWRLRLPEGQIE
jgi:hypothetical protein